MTNRAILGFGLAAVSALAVLGVVVALRPRRAAAPSPAPGAGAPRSGGPALAPALAALLAEVDAAWPTRSRVSDGGAPSAAHHAANPTSDHERMDAYDFTADWVNGPDPGALAELARQDPRVSIVIWNEQIANKAREGNAWRKYERTKIQIDPHKKHVHVSVRHDARDDARPWNAASIARKSIA